LQEVLIRRVEPTSPAHAVLQGGDVLLSSSYLNPTDCPILLLQIFKKKSTFVQGVLIRRVEPTSPAHAILQGGDVLLTFDGVDVASDGTVPFRSGERIGFSYLVSESILFFTSFITCVLFE
jgi:hypothetical protein